MQTSIIIPNYNGKHLLEKNLSHVLKSSNNGQVIIVDDASTDGSNDFIKVNYPQVTLIEKATNNGFATSVNLAVKAAHEDIVILLNSDVEPKFNFLKFLLVHFKDPKVFAVGSLDQSWEGKKLVKRGRGIGKFFQGFLLHDRGETDKTNTLWVSGGSGAFRKKYWEELGGMDDIYDPFYWEDIDLSYRALKKGYRLVFEPKSQVIHLHSQGSVSGHYDKFQINVISYRNQFIFIWKNITDIKYLVNHFVWLPYRILVAIVNSDWAMLKGFFNAIIKLPAIYRKRKLNNFLKNDSEILNELTC